uniref:Uncharacterized protein n=1 Tax=Setaria italica TaxID=4555 RepID=K3Z1W2_SETIT
MLVSSPFNFTRTPSPWISRTRSRFLRGRKKPNEKKAKATRKHTSRLSVSDLLIAFSFVRNFVCTCLNANMAL